MNETDISKQIDESPEKRALEIRRRVDKLLRNLLEGVWDENAQANNPKLDFIANVRERVTNIIPEASEEVSKAFGELADSGESDRVNLLTQTENIVISLLAENLTLPELERRLNSRPREEQHEELTRGFECEIQGSIILLHVPITFFDKPKEVIQSLASGLKALAEKVKNEEKYKAATEIVGYSELVKKNHKLLTKYGFTVVLDESGNPSDEARMSVEKFLETFGQ